MRGIYKKTQRYESFAKAFLALTLVYLLFHLFLSERSIPALIQVSKQEQQLLAQLEELQTQKANIYDRVVRLRPRTMDPDLVEDYAIKMLGHGAGDEVIVMNDAQS